MTDLDLDRLGQLWRAELPAGTVEGLQRSAARIRRRARIAMIVDYTLAAACVLTIIYLIASTPKLEVMAVGGVALFMLVTGQMRQRRLRQLELKGLTGGTASMIDQSIVRAEATLKRTKSSLLLVIPATAVGVLLGFVSGDTIDPLFDRLRGDPISFILLVSLWLVVLPMMIMHLLLSMRRNHRELKRLKALREAYRQEEGAGASDD